jgi:hypothetical protein
MIADPEGPSFITRTVGHRRYADGASVTHDPNRNKSPHGDERADAPSREAAILMRRKPSDTTFAKIYSIVVTDASSGRR